MTATPTRAALVTALAAHAAHVGPITGSWKCPPPCNATSTNGDIRAGTLTTRDERAAEWREHLADVLLSTTLDVGSAA